MRPTNKITTCTETPTRLTMMNRGTKRKRASASGKSLGRAAAVLRDANIREFWTKDDQGEGGIVEAERKTLRIKGGTLVTYPSMVLPDERTDNPPRAQAPEEEWTRSGWVPFVGEGKQHALFFPVYSEVLTAAEVEVMQAPAVHRCIPTKDPDRWYYVPRDHFHRLNADGSEDQCHYIANGVRHAQKGETANCRLVEDTSADAEKRGDPCMLASICKTQHPTEWKLDVDYAQRMLGIDEDMVPDDDEQSVEEVPARALRSKTRVLEESAVEDFRERMILGLEMCGVNLDKIVGLLSNLPTKEDFLDLQDVLQGHREDQVDQTRGVMYHCKQTETRMARAVNRLERLATLAEEFMYPTRVPDWDAIEARMNQSSDASKSDEKPVPIVMDLAAVPEKEVATSTVVVAPAPAAGVPVPPKVTADAKSSKPPVAAKTPDAKPTGLVRGSGPKKY